MDNTSVKETLCTKCLHSPVCVHKSDYLAMAKRLEELFYSVPKEGRSAMVLEDPACKFYEKKLEVPPFWEWRKTLSEPVKECCCDRKEMEKEN